MKRKITFAALTILTVVAILSGCNLFAQKQPAQPLGAAEVAGISHLRRLNIVPPTEQPTADAAFIIDAKGLGLAWVVNNAAGTPVAYSDRDGAITYSGFSSGGGVINASVGINAPTAQATATPALYVNSTGAGNNLFEARAASTPVVAIQKDGDIIGSGSIAVAVPTGVGTATPMIMGNSAGGVGNLLELRQASTPVFQVGSTGNLLAGQAAVFNNAVYVAVPTSVGTATPAIMANSAGGVGNLLSLRQAATPVFAVDKNGNLTTAQAASFSNAAYIAVPTAVGTATPALMVNSAAGVGNLFELRQAATPVFQVAAGGGTTLTGALTAGGAIAGLSKVSTQTGVDIAVPMTASGTYYNDIGDTGAITFTLAAASAGAWFCFTNVTGDDWIIDVDASDKINITASAGNKITNTTAGNGLCMYAADTTNWIVYSIMGTWADGS